MDIGIVNYEHNYDGLISPALLRISGYVDSTDPTKIAVFFHSFTPFYTNTDEGQEINCTDSTGLVKCYF